MRSVSRCPLCDDTAFTATGPGVDGLVVTCGGREFRQPPYAVRECGTCGLLYKDQTAGLADLDQYYAAADYRKWETPGHFPTERTALAHLGRLAPGARILDFGCSSGRLLAPLARRCRCAGFEPNPAAAQAAAAKGIHMLPALDPSHGRFDAIVMADVFEHLRAPADTLRRLCALLRPGGRLLLLTGNGDAPACRIAPARFWYFRNVEHLCMLTPRATAWLARALGCALEHWQELSHFDAPLLQRWQKAARHFSYWQFRRRTLLSQTILPLLPGFNRARHWPEPPINDLTRDHVLVILRCLK